MKLHTLQDKIIGVKVSDTVLPPITGLYITFGIYMEIYGGFGHNGKIIQHTLPSHTQPSCSKLTGLGQFLKLHTLQKRNMCMKVSDTVLSPITGLNITFGAYMEALGTVGR